MCDYDTLVMLAVHQENGVLNKFAGSIGIVQHILEYVHCDEEWIDWLVHCDEAWIDWYNLSMPREKVDKFIQRLKLPHYSVVEETAAISLVERIAYDITFNRYRCDFSVEMLKMMFEAVKDHSFTNRITRAVYKIYGPTLGSGRFAKTELKNLDFERLKAEGIEVLRIFPNMNGMSVCLTNETGQWVTLDLIITNDYPFRCPRIKFTGFTRPTRFESKTEFSIDTFYDYSFAGVEDSLRVVLLDMNMFGVSGGTVL